MLGEVIEPVSFLRGLDPVNFENPFQVVTPGIMKTQTSSVLYPALRRLLLVDDEEPIIWLFEEGLANIPGCEITSVTTGEEALLLFDTASFDLLITDYKMPGMDGLALAKNVHELYPQTQIVMLTAYGSLALSEQAGRAGIRRVLDKPVRLDEMRRLVAELLGGNG